MPTRLPICIALFALLLALPQAARAAQAPAKKAETVAQREAREAAVEDEAESKLEQHSIKRKFEGKLTFTPPDAERPGVIGTFTTSTKTFLVKLEADSVRDSLAPHNGKMITVTGRIRNQGLYLIVQGILERSAPPIENPKRGGV